MHLVLCFIICFSVCCLLILVCLPSMIKPSREAERMFALVRSHRAEQQRGSFADRMTTLLVAQSRRLRGSVGLKQDAKLTRRFVEAGLRGSSIVDVFFGVQAMGLFCGGALGSMMSDNTIFWMLAGAAFGFMAPDVWLTSRQKSRRELIRRSIPDMVDLLVVCVGAGLGLDQALLRVGEELSISHPQITQELERVSLERQAGAPRLEAWKSLAERTRIEELSSFTNMLSETDRFGTPIVKALSEFSEEIRVKRRQRAEEAAAKTKIKIIFPLVLCIFPCIFIVLLAPALLSITKGFSTMGR